MSEVREGRVEAVGLHQAIDVGEDGAILGPRGGGAAGDEYQCHGGGTEHASEDGTDGAHGRENTPRGC